MTQVSVDAGYLEELASEQDEAAERINSATMAVDGTATKLLWDHGVICSAFVIAMKAAEKERENAGGNMQTVSEDLAEGLRVGAEAFEKTDTQAARNVDRQVLDG